MKNKASNNISNNAVWSAVGRYSAIVVQFLVTAVLARYVDPSDYGIIGILSVFIAVASVFFDAGLSQSLIQKGTQSSKDFSTVFFFNLFVSTAIYIILYVTLPFIGNFYNSNDLSKYGRLIFLVIPISSLGIVSDAILRIQFRFKELAVVQVVSALISGVVGVVIAYNGGEIYALVWHSISLNLSKSLLVLIYTKWLPELTFSKASLFSLLPFGMSLLVTTLIKTVFNNIYTLVIGKSFSSSDVAYYNQAKRLEELSGYTILGILLSVSFPAFVKLRENVEELKSSYINLMRMSVYLIVPIYCLLILSDCEVITIVFSDTWLQAVPYFDLLCIYGATLPLHLINENILKVFGKGKQIVFLEVVRRVSMIIAIVLTVKISVSAMLLGQILSTIPVIIISMTISGKHINYQLIDQFKDVLPFYFIGILSFFSVFFLSKILPDGIFVGLLAKSVLFVVAYYGLTKIFKVDLSNKLFQIIKKK